MSKLHDDKSPPLAGACLAAGDRPGWGVGEVLKLAAPAALSMVNMTIMQFVDAVMVARLVGPAALSATFVAGILAFIPISLGTGTCFAVNTFVSQSYGAGRRLRCSAYAWQGLFLAVLFAALMTPLIIAGRPLLEQAAAMIVRLEGKPTSSLELGFQTVYFQILIAGAAGRLVTTVMERYFYGSHRPGVVYVASVVSLLVNIAGNYVLITGWWIFPEMGLAGAAVGTVFSWAVAGAILLAAFLGRASHEQFGARRTWRPRPRLCRDILRVGLPAGVQFCNDVSCWSVFNVFLVGYFGTVHRAASAAATRYMHVSFMPAIGIGIACTALVGKYIGAGRPEVARRRVHTAVLIAGGYMTLCGLAFFVFRYPLIRLFADSIGSAEVTSAQTAEIIRIGAWVLICAAVFQGFDAIGITFIGALRGAGDTLWPMLVTMVLSWGMVVGGGIAMVWYVPQLTSIGPWIAASAFVIIMGPAMAWRFESGRWRKIDLLGRAVAVPTPAPPLTAAPAMSQAADPIDDGEELQAKGHEEQ